MAGNRVDRSWQRLPCFAIDTVVGPGDASPAGDGSEVIEIDRQDVVKGLDSLHDRLLLRGPYHPAAVITPLRCAARRSLVCMSRALRRSERNEPRT